MQHAEFLPTNLSHARTSEQRDPLPGAIVSLYDAPVAAEDELSSPVVSDTCDSAGRYTIHLHSSRLQYWTVIVDKTGFVQIRDRVLIREPGTIAKNYELSPGNACVEGKITDDDRRPISGARVSISEIKSGGLSLAFMRSIPAKTDMLGRFSISRLKEGRLMLMASGRDYMDDQRQISSSSGPCAQVDFCLKPAKTIIIRVKNKAGVVLPDSYRAICYSRCAELNEINE